MKKVFIDGKAGTTGLRIYERLSDRKDIEWITLPEELRKDTEARRNAMNSADIVFLCLPDDAAIEAVSMIENENTVVIDTSTAHRTADGWTYGFPELTGNKEKIKNSKRISNPGCHASGFIALVTPLVEKGILPKDIDLTCFSITGYSGGGKKLISQYEEKTDPLFEAPRQYAIAQQHKHLKEMIAVSGIENAPIFCPIVSDFYSGMELTIPVFAKDINGTVEDIKQVYSDYYKDAKIVKFAEGVDEKGNLSAAALSGRDDMYIEVYGNEERIILVARYDNLGKGASGSAIQNMNIVLGLDETAGLVTEE